MSEGLYHLHHESVTASDGKRCAADRAAYLEREGEKWADKKDALVYTESQYPSWANGDSATFWKAVDDHERKKGKLYEELEFAIPHELSVEDRIEVAKTWREKSVLPGCPYTLNVHDKGDSGIENWHCHIMFSTRQDDGIERSPELWFKRAASNYRDARTGKMESKGAETGGVAKQTDVYGSRDFLGKARLSWEEHFNEFAKNRGYDVVIDRRSNKERGIDIEPQKHLGKALYQAQREGIDLDNKNAQRLLDEYNRIAKENGEKIIADPGLALSYLTQHSSTFTDKDLYRFVWGHVADEVQFHQAIDAVKSSYEFVNLSSNTATEGGDDGGIYTTISLLQTEQDLVGAAVCMAEQNTHAVDPGFADKIADEKGLSDDQKQAFNHIVQGGDSVCVSGFAGAGKSYMLGAVNDAYTGAGFNLMGVALAGQAASGLQKEAGISSSTLHSLLSRINSGKVILTYKDIIVLDEAGMVGTRQYAELMEKAEKAGAKLIQVGDAQQLQSIEAGGAFKSVCSRTGFAEMDDVKRVKEEWAKEATRNFARGNTRAALKEYVDRGTVKAGKDREETMSGMVEAWHQADTDSKAMLAFTRADVAQLNSLAREAVRDQLGQDIELQTEAGKRPFATGDQVIFLRNDYRDLQVKNGTKGVLEGVDQDGQMQVRLADEDRLVSFNVADYGHIDHGYATTIHKSQGATYDQTFVLASKHLDQHSTYVAMSRHRDQARMFVDRSEIKSTEALYNICSRQRQKDLAIDFALSRGIDLDDQQADKLRQDALAQAQQFKEVTQQPAAAPFDAQTWLNQQAQRHDISQEGLAYSIKSGNLNNLLTAHQLDEQQRQAIHDQARATLLSNPDRQADYMAHQQGQLSEYRQVKVEAFQYEKLAEHEQKWAWLKDPEQVKESAYEARHDQEYIDARALHQDLQQQHKDILDRRAAVQGDLDSRGLMEIGPRRQLKKSAVELDEQERQIQARMTTTEKKLEKMRDTTNVQGFKTRMVGQQQGEREWIEKQTVTMRSQEYSEQRRQAELIDGRPAHKQTVADRLPERVEDHQQQQTVADGLPQSAQNQQQPKKDVNQEWGR